MNLKNPPNRAQAEMFGLLFIVMLISIALILIAASEVNRKPSEIKKTFEKSEIATNTINTLIKTRTANCNNLDLGELYIDCARNPESPKVYCNNGQDSCTYARATTIYILTQTLDVWKKQYLINMSVGNDEIMSYGSGDLCPHIEREVETVPLPLNPGTLMIELWICG